MTTYTIEDDVPPLPEYRGRPRSAEHQAMATMEVGQSFVITDESRARHARMISCRIRKGAKFTVRKVGGEGWRVWRLA